MSVEEASQPNFFMKGHRPIIALMALLLAFWVHTPADAQKRDGWIYPTFVDSKTGLIKARMPMKKAWLDEKNVRRDADGTTYYQNRWSLKPLLNYQFQYAQDPGLVQIIRQNGGELLAPMSLDQWLHQWFRPKVEQQLGYTFEKSYALPEVAQAYAQGDINTYLTGQTSQYDAMGTEWINDSGGSSFALLVQLIHPTAYNQVTWVVLVRELMGPRDGIDDAVNDFVYSESANEINPEWVMATARQTGAQMRVSRAKWDQLMQQSRQAHWSRINSIQARGQTAQNTASIYSDILDISHSGYMNRSNIVDAGQSHSVRATRGNVLIENPHSGETYEVPQGGEHFWVNQDGAFVSTDNTSFDPRRQIQISDQQWTKFKVLE